MRYTKKRQAIEYNYIMNNQTLDCKQEMKYLGVWFDCQLAFIKHIDEVCKSAAGTLGFIVRKSKHFSAAATTECLLYSLVCSRMEYAAAIWNLIYTGHKLKLERIQRSFLKISQLQIKWHLSRPKHGSYYTFKWAQFRFVGYATRSCFCHLFIRSPK